MRGKFIGLGIILSVFAPLSCQNSEHDPSDYYTAAVVEFSPTYRRDNGLVTLRENANVYIEYIEKASKQNADIIVFPEDGLTSVHMPAKSRMDSWATVVPSVLDRYVPCTGTDVNVSETLKRLSCAARENRIYVLVNIAEKRFCNREHECPPSGVHYHNTNVVFDRTGKIIARYRKVNLYMESRFDKTETPEIVTFDTDFGVRFGTFTCFDILFSVPALNLTRTEGISNIVFPTAWFSELPFLTAVQTQFGWSFAEDVNLLVAGYHQPDVGAMGSGIYLGRNGIANATMSREPGNRLLISRVPKTTRSGRTEEDAAVREPTITNEKKEASYEERVTVYRGITADFQEKSNEGNTEDSTGFLHDNVASFESVPLNVSMSETVCHRNFCCDFHVRTSIVDSSSTNYRAVVYNGIRLYGVEVTAGVRLCALIQCSTDSLLSCGTVGRSNTTFTTLNITAKFDDYPEILVMPTVLGPSLLPFDSVWSYVERTHENQTDLTIALDTPTKDLVTFGIYVRDFDKDKWN